LAFKSQAVARPGAAPAHFWKPCQRAGRAEIVLLVLPWRKVIGKNTDSQPRRADLKRPCIKQPPDSKLNQARSGGPQCPGPPAGSEYGQLPIPEKARLHNCRGWKRRPARPISSSRRRKLPPGWPVGSGELQAKGRPALCGTFRNSRARPRVSSRKCWRGGKTNPTSTPHQSALAKCPSLRWRSPVNNPE